MPRNKFGLFQPPPDAPYEKHAAHAEKLRALADDERSPVTHADADEADAAATEAAKVTAAPSQPSKHAPWTDRHFPQAGSITTGRK